MEIKEYIFGDTAVQYLIDKKVSLILVPKKLRDKVKKPWEQPNGKINPRAEYVHDWRIGSLVHFYASEYNLSCPGITMKCDAADNDVSFEKQEKIAQNGAVVIRTYLKTARGYQIIHNLTYYEGRRGFEIETEFKNNGDAACELQMLTSFSLDNLSPFQCDDAPNKYFLHRFYGGWSLEGKHVCTSIEDLALEKSWAGFLGTSEKFGNIGSYPVERYFPAAVFEDREIGAFWAVQLANNSTWQMELTRTGDTLSLCGGIGDNDFCGWRKKIKPGESFCAPKAFVSTAIGDFETACAGVTDMQKTAYFNYGEKGLPVTFNEYCSTWGRPTQKKMLAYCNALKEYGVKYAVIDAGWCREGCEQEANGEWNADRNIFPDMREMNRQIRDMGMIPGIWFEFEVTTEGSKMFAPEYDYMHLKRDGRVIKSNDVRSYWDFRRSDVREYLHEKVIDFLKSNGFGYIKIDYNRNIGRYIDDADCGAEALRLHMNEVRSFFEEIKREIPDIIIENCASGGHRLEPSMIGVSAVSSFSDAHEAVEIPYIAANLHRLMLPAQSLIWSTLHKEDCEDRTVYSLAATFLGRICLSGDVDMLTPRQREILHNAIEFYAKLNDVIINGTTHIFGNRGRNTRYPSGTQAVVRSAENEILAVCHAFDNPCGKIEIDIPSGFEICDEFYAENISVSGEKLIINKMNRFTAAAVLLRKNFKGGYNNEKNK